MDLSLHLVALLMKAVSLFIVDTMQIVMQVLIFALISLFTACHKLFILFYFFLFYNLFLKQFYLSFFITGHLDYYMMSFSDYNVMCSACIFLVLCTLLFFPP